MVTVFINTIHWIRFLFVKIPVQSFCCCFICCEQHIVSPSQTTGCRIHHGAHAETGSRFVPGASLTLALAHQGLWRACCSYSSAAEAGRRLFTANSLNIPLAFVTATLHADAGTEEEEEKERGRRQKAGGCHELDHRFP